MCRGQSRHFPLLSYPGYNKPARRTRVTLSSQAFHTPRCNDGASMYTLANHALEVSILDPIADQGRFGPRYCTGGYIYQVADNKLGDLMSGPTYPDKFNWFDGQGIPDAFHLSPLRDPAATDSI